MYRYFHFFFYFLDQMARIKQIVRLFGNLLKPLNNDIQLNVTLSAYCVSFSSVPITYLWFFRSITNHTALEAKNATKIYVMSVLDANE